MKRRLLKTMAAVLAIAAAAAGPVRGQNSYNVTFGGFNNPDMNTTVNVASLPETFAGVGVYDFYPFEVISDYCGEFTGASVTSGGDGKVSVNIPSSNQMTITVSGTFEGTATIHIEGYDTEVGDVSRDITVACALPPTPHTVRLAAGTEEAANWTLASGNASVPGTQVLGNVMSGSQVTATYNGTQKVKSVKAVKYVAPPDTAVAYSFDNASSPSMPSASRVGFDYAKTSVITNTAFLNAFNNQNGDPSATSVSLGTTNLSDKSWTLSFEWAACGGCNSKPDHTTLKSGSTTLFDFSGNSNWNETVTIIYSGSDGTKTLPVSACDKDKRFTDATGNQLNTTAYWHHVVITGGADGVKMTITNSSTGTTVVQDVVLSATNVNPTELLIEPCCGGAIGIDELLLIYTE